jgi:hypothetical protein
MERVTVFGRLFLASWKQNVDERLVPRRAERPSEMVFGNLEVRFDDTMYKPYPIARSRRVSGPKQHIASRGVDESPVFSLPPCLATRVQGFEWRKQRVTDFRDVARHDARTMAVDRPAPQNSLA